MVCLGHVRFCKAYKDVRLTVASPVRSTGVVSTRYLHCYIYCSARESIWQLFVFSQYQILDIIGKDPKHQMHIHDIVLRE